MITSEGLKKKFKIVLGIEIILAIIIIYVMCFYKPNYYSKFSQNRFKVKQDMSTSNTTRISGKDFYETAISISQLNYPATFYDNRPNAVILVRGDKKEDAILSSRLMHDPINAPILYINKKNIPKVTLDEIKRLNPKGIRIDRNNKIIIIGDVDDSIKNELKKNHFKFRHINGENPFSLGKNIDDYYSALNGNHKDIVMTVPIDMADYALAETAWSAYSGDPILFIKRDEIPKETSESLHLRHGGSYMYLLGNDKLIQNNTKQGLLKHGHLQYISLGESIYGQSTSFAVFRDIGKNSAWWIDKNPRQFGWGISEAGHNFIFVNPDEWQSAVAASGLSFKSKCGPMILIENNKIPQDVINYLKVVKPMKTHPQGQIYNSGWIIGEERSINKNIQSQLDEFLSYEED
ncbi:cell wall-binding repeat-containing protein [Clostridium botulinum]|uniref:Cell surface protein n=1 Tax=Clostridium botulinum C/D str. DC5 TaxID=1443128 RepID=A0A0A0I3N4_CLOBO|nr:cell wall-binding repeat-containing protein [Clostridium botulinum]KGM96019.1 cell surface protein [Clostridium botulinum C/D str. DC5]KOC54949.1 cell surface protein [Clostridium botulinum]KOC58316.1 cell surface protein [Clostridium botulinum]MCD3233652.1 cell wall-binding repeat-containing protein [Clostridium botulinum D/C]MCD3240086.1 cell wall-binding repeat-containing protein [Clostridium botulinum D/C]